MRTEWMVRSKVADSSILGEQHLSPRAVNVRIAQPCASGTSGKITSVRRRAILSQRIQNWAPQSRWGSTCDRAAPRAILANSLVTLPISHVLRRPPPSSRQQQQQQNVVNAHRREAKAEKFDRTTHFTLRWSSCVEACVLPCGSQS